MTTITAQISENSVEPHSPRLTTILTRSPRWIHAEGRTHRRVRIGEELEFEVRTPSPMEDPNLSRNASSSRAIPVSKMIDEVMNETLGLRRFGGAGRNGDSESNRRPVTGTGRGTHPRIAQRGPIAGRRSGAI